ncbi:hypothetical protein [Solitalea canadensis]|uniref:Glycine zipper domain-containing protein n=1 Tax=Solitalea canadensis (strain ATCC 29591 / DSM 3403 / JCM 21819 / LMG 8368 / NBRC 15130 / NCIMB 12057 / USAM 9D) TaxID=929556 RepID=H8KUH8_SOLCM|nr:hypothetical protein [Solitalea canadensis]AFD07343.1 hypothetical protein Solca_2301 [Solitalea canadensis DSM 3403]
MPQSRNRQKHHTHQQAHHQQHSAVQSHPVPYKKNKTSWFFAIFVGIIGAVVAFFLYKMNWISAVSGAVIGGIFGYLIGNFISKASKTR